MLGILCRLDYIELSKMHSVVNLTTTSNMHKLTSIISAVITRKIQLNLGRLTLSLCAVTTTVAWATAGDAFVINCVTCKATSDFVTAAKQAAWSSSYSKLKCDHILPPSFHNSSGTYIVASQSYPLTALVDVRGYVSFAAGGSGYLCNTALHITSATAIDEKGKPIKSDAEMEHIEGFFWGGTRKPGPPQSVTIDPNQASSPMQIQETFDVVMGGFINNALIKTGVVDLSKIPVGTIIEVKFQDGSKAKFVRGIVTNSLTQWLIVPGTLTNKNGQRINLDGSLAHNTSSVPGTTPSTSYVDATPNPTNPYGYFPNPSPIGVVTVDQLFPISVDSGSASITTTWSDGSTSVDTVFMPTGGGP